MKKAFLNFLICGILFFGAIYIANAEEVAAVPDSTSQQGVDTSGVTLTDSTYTLPDSTSQINYEEINRCNAQSLAVFKYVAIFYVSWFVALVIAIFVTLYYLKNKEKKFRNKL
ncbi:MAG: hypothetical protein Q8862_06375 [Bacteroidota bacterium]|nr:hypothetical protein [Bacteroidota bacterium]